MPDATRKTISASQGPALFNASPYLTKWMLYRFLKGDTVAKVDGDETSRMAWGTKLQPLILEQTAADLAIEVEPNFGNDYVRQMSGPLGYTADGYAFDPNRGSGLVECKCCFDYGTWMREWLGGEQPPRHVELQLQQQLAVGDGAQPYEWGIIAVWVCAEVKYFRRDRDPKVGQVLVDAALDMLLRVDRNDEPDPFGEEIEVAALAALFPTVKGKELDLREDINARKWAELAAAAKHYTADRKFFEKAEQATIDQLKAFAKDHQRVLLPNGYSLTLSTSHVEAKTIERKAYTSKRLNIHHKDDDEQSLENRPASELPAKPARGGMLPPV